MVVAARAGWRESDKIWWCLRSWQLLPVYPPPARQRSASPGPRGQLPITAEDLTDRPSGDVFGWTQDVGMGWNPAELRRFQPKSKGPQPLARDHRPQAWIEGGAFQDITAEDLREIPLSDPPPRFTAEDVTDRIIDWLAHNRSALAAYTAHLDAAGSADDARDGRPQ